MRSGIAQQIQKNHPVTIFENYCMYEHILPQVRGIRAITVDSLVGAEDQYSETARSEPDFDAGKWLKLERRIAGLALANIENNISRLVVKPEIKRVHFTDLSEKVINDFDAEVIILSGTLRDFDFYRDELFDRFNEFIVSNRVPVLAICGGHQMVGQAYGARVVTLDDKLPSERRRDRMVEYQYRFVNITDESDPIFSGLLGHPGYERRHKSSRVLRVWQNHGLQLDRLPEGFRNLARGYLSEQQMMVRRTLDQLIYGVQFHIEKSFQDWNLDNYWHHRIESRDGRLIFENFLIEALAFLGRTESEIFASDEEIARRNTQLTEGLNGEDLVKESGW